MTGSQLITMPQGMTIARERRPLPPPAELLALADMLYKGGLSNKGITRPEAIVLRIVAGWEVGLSPIQACNNIMVTNGRATIWGDGAIALVRASGLLELFEERIDGTGNSQVAVCRMQRRGEQVREYRFSVDDAIRANLWLGGNASKGALDTPWAKYPQRMLQMKARAWLLRDTFADVLCGLGITEETEEYEGARAVEVTTATAPTVTVTVDSPPALQAASLTTPAASATPATGEVDPVTLTEIAAKLPAWLDRKGLTIDQFRDQLQADHGVRQVKLLTQVQATLLLMELEIHDMGNVPTTALAG
jgi:hypothetical protein